MDDDTQDALAKIRAEAAQAQENLAQGATSVARFFNELVEGGLHRDEALTLTTIWLQNMLNTAGLVSGIETLIKGAEEEDE